MNPLHVAGLGVAAAALVGGAVALAARRRPAPGATPAAPGASAAGQQDDPVAAPAYPYLDHWTQDERRALRDLQVELGLDPLRGGLAGVIGHESAGDPAVPLAQGGTPRGGLIQVTVDARLPGYDTAEKVWAIRSQGRVQQLRGVVRDYYRRQMPHGPPADQGAAQLLRRNYLPAVTGKPATFVLGVRPDGKRDADGALLPGQKAAGTGPGGEKPDDVLPGNLKLGVNYAANPGFDPSGRGWFTWEDVDRQAARAEQAALARGWTRVSGARVPPGDLPVAGVAMSQATLSDTARAALRVQVDGIESLRAGWSAVIAARDAAPADCPCRGATGPMIADWLKFDTDYREQTARTGSHYGGTPSAEQFALDYYRTVLAGVQVVQSGLVGGDPLPGEAVLDVRELAEFAASPRTGAHNVPISDIDRDGIDHVVEWAAGRPVVAYCRAGVRAARVVALLLARGIRARNGHESLVCGGPALPASKTASEANLW